MINILKIGWWHNKNNIFLNNLINNKEYNIVNDINDANIIISSSYFIDANKYPTKKFIFGPHFSVFPNNIICKVNNINNNCVYIQPSQPSVNTWQKEFNFTTMPMKAMPFGVDTNNFKSSNDNKKNIFLYYKDRNPEELGLIKKYLEKKNIKYKIFNYKQKYKENEYLGYLKTCKYGIWLGRHESQGFALQEALSCNVPLLVWNVKLRKQEWSSREVYKNIKSEVSTIPYWDKRCGEFFYEYNELDNKFNIFIQNLNTYEPRNFIIENLSMEACYKKWNNFFNNLLNNKLIKQ